MRQKSNKPTMKDLIRMIGQMAIDLKILSTQIINSDRVLSEYIEMKDDTDKFLKFLKDKMNIDDQDNKETKEK